MCRCQAGRASTRLSRSSTRRSSRSMPRATGCGCSRRSGSSLGSGWTRPARRARSRCVMRAVTRRMRGASETASRARTRSAPSNAASPTRATSSRLSTRSSPRRACGDGTAQEMGLQMCGDLFFYWHIRGKNITAKEYAAAFLAVSDADGAPTVGRAAGPASPPDSARGSLVSSAGPARSRQRRIGSQPKPEQDMRRAKPRCSRGSRCSGSMSRQPKGGRATASSMARRARFSWAEGLASTFDGIAHADRR